MTTLRIDSFMGMFPKLSNRLLPDSAAASVQNARLLSGELRGIKTPSRIFTFSSGTNLSAYRLFKSDDTPVWLGLSDADSDVVKGPLVNDSLNRHYWTGEESYVAYNSDTRIENGDPAYRLGTPTPLAAASLVVTGGTDPTETRAYTYTFVNDWGEESAPAPVVQASGAVDGSWDLSGLPTSAPDMTNRQAISHKRIYRTVTGLSTVSYYLVEDNVPLGTASTSDTTTNSEAALGTVLDTFGWEVPPDTLQGLVVHPGGFLVGFDGSDLYFSERYRPHTWPPEYILSVEHEIVGLAVYNNMLGVMTKGTPYFFSGNRPENLTPIRSPIPEPCLSKASISATLRGVFYASPNGLVLFNEAGPTVVTSQIMSVEEWATYSPANMRGAAYAQEYIGFYATNRAIRFAPNERLGVFSEIDIIDNVDDILTDHTSGDLWLVQDNEVSEWEPPSGVPLFYTWLSKEFELTRPTNFGVFIVKTDQSAPVPVYDEDDIALLSAYNVAREAADPPDALNPINLTPVNGKLTTPVNVGTVPAGIDEIVQNQYPIGGSPLYDLDFVAASETEVNVTIFAGGEEVLTETIEPNVIYRMPSGFKSDLWQVRLVGNADIYSFAMASTKRELENV